MKHIKVIMSLFLVIAMILGICNVGYAETLPKENKVVINEYELSKELSLKSKDKLTAMGYSSGDVEKIKNYHQTYVDHFNKLKKLDDSTLSKHGYTPEQIATLKNFDGSETQATILSATLTIYSTATNFSYDGDLTRGRLAYNWYWTGVPAFLMKDAVAASWNDWEVENNSSYVSYFSVMDGSFYTTTSATYSTDGNGLEGAGHKFSAQMSDAYYYAKQGGGTFDVCSDVHVLKNFFYYIAYGHQQYGASISFSIGFGGGDASITFNTGTVIVGHEIGSYKF